MLYNLQRWENTFKLEVKRIQLENKKIINKDEDYNQSQSPMVKRRENLTEVEEKLKINLASKELENNIFFPKEFDLSEISKTLSKKIDEEYNIFKKQCGTSETMNKIKVELEKVDIILNDNISFNIPQILPYYSTLKSYILNNNPTDDSLESLKSKDSNIEIKYNEENHENKSKKKIKTIETQSLQTASKTNTINISKNNENTVLSPQIQSSLQPILVVNENSKPININDNSILNYISSSLSWLFGWSSESTEFTKIKIDKNQQVSLDSPSPLSITQLEERIINLEKIIDQLQQNKSNIIQNEKENLDIKPTSNSVKK